MTLPRRAPLLTRRWMLSALLIAGFVPGLWAQPVRSQREVALPEEIAQARFEHLTVADGLPENSVRNMMQDHLGFLWFGTQNGLVRYDGREMTVFQYDPNDPYSFSGRFVDDLHEDGAGNVWIGTRNAGLVHYDRATGHFTAHRNNAAEEDDENRNMVLYFHEDQRGQFWVVGSEMRLYRFDPARAASEPDHAFTRYRHDPNDPTSLSNDHVVNIREDRTGHLWVATRGGGLNRYDPQTETFTAYRHDPADPQSLASDTVYTAYEDRRGVLWVGTRQGLDRLGPGTGTPGSGQAFTHYAPDPRLFFREAADPGRPVHLLPAQETASGLWFYAAQSQSPTSSAAGVDRLVYYDRATDTFTPLHPDPNDPTSIASPVASFLEDRSGTVWAGTFLKGVNKLDRTVRFPRFEHDPDSPNSLGSNAVLTVYEAPSEPGIVWIGTAEGLDRLDRATGTFTHYRHDPQDSRSLGAGIVRTIHEDRAGRLWVGTLGGGLNRLNRATSTFTRYQHDPADPASLNANQVMKIQDTPDGSVWVGTSNDGLDRFDPETETFTHYTAADSSYHPDLYRQVRAHPDERRLAALLRIGNRADQTQRFTIDAPTQVFVLGMGTFMRSELTQDYGWIEDDAGNVVWEMTAEQGRGAGATRRNIAQAALLDLAPGAYRLRFRSDETYGYGAWESAPPDHPDLWGIQVLQVTGAEARALATLLPKIDENRLSQREVHSLYAARDGMLWIGTDGGGLNRLDPETGVFTDYRDRQVGPYSVQAIHEDAAGRLWIGDYIHGLHRIDPDSGSVQRFMKADGLPNMTVISIIEDEAGSLWLSTPVGLVRATPEAASGTNVNLRFTHYGVDNGIPIGDVRASGFRSADGMLFFGSEGGVSVIDPRRLTDDPHPPEVALTGFDVFNEPAALGPDAPLQPMSST